MAGRSHRSGQYHVGRELDQFRRISAREGVVAGRPAVVDAQIAANGPTQFRQLLQEGADAV
jgi:hypothetical protein